MPVVTVIGIGLGCFVFGLFVGLVIGTTSDRNTYKKCRYYDQTIERCVAELGWEKK